MRTSFALVFNARAGVARPKLLDDVLGFLKASGANVFQLAARSSEEATERVAELAQRQGADAVIAAGGDGTFRAVASGAAGTDLPVGFLPLGTGNVLAYEIGLQKHATRLARGLLDNPTIAVRGGLANGAPFFLMAGAGYDARIVQGLNYKTKRLLGRVAYTMPVLRALAHGAETFDVVVDGTAYDASWVIVTRACRYGGSFLLTRDTRLGDERMVAIIINAVSRTALLRSSLDLGLGRLTAAATQPAFVSVVPAHRVIIGRRTPTPVQIDGDDAAISPAEIVADGPVVQLIAPAAYADDLFKRHKNHLG